jgi:3-deoxy-D-manno-octulosonic-acid transferase
VQAYRPDIGVLMETEVWPNLVRACTDAGVPLVLANARCPTSPCAAPGAPPACCRRPTAR